MKRIKTITALLLPMLLMASCLKDQIAIDIAEREKEITFSLKLPGVRNATRALDPADEEIVGGIEVYVFNSSGRLVDMGYGYAITDESQNNEIIKSFSVKLRPGTGLELMVTGNAKYIIEDAYPAGVPIDGTVTRAEFVSKLTASIPANGKWVADKTDADYKRIPMWGTRKNATIADNTSFKGSNGLSMTRMLAKVTVGLGSDVLPAEYKLTGVHLYNYNTSGLLIPDDNNGAWNGAKPYATAPSLPSAPGFTAGPQSYSQMTTAGREIRGEIYAFEAPAGSRSNFTGNTCLVIGCEYKGVEYFYRIDFSQNQSGVIKYLPILRNHHYIVTVKKVNGPGFTNQIDALNSLPYNIEAEVKVWNDGDLDGVVFDGNNNYMKVDPLSYTYWRSAAQGLVSITTDHEDGWDFEITDSPDAGGDPVDWLEATTRTDHGSGTTDTLNFKVSAHSGVNIRKSYIHISAGSMDIVVSITQGPWELLTIEATPEGMITGEGGVRKIVATGNYPELNVRARNLTGNVTLAEGVLPASTSGSDVNITIPEFWNATDRHLKTDINIAYQYQDPADNQWKFIETVRQISYYVDEVTSDHVDGTEIRGMGKKFTVTAKGDFPSIRLRVFNGTTALNTAYIYGNTEDKTAQLTVPYNEGAARTIYLQYSLNNGSTWFTISSGSQPKGYMILETSGRVVAVYDTNASGGLVYNTTATMNWSQAMAVPTTYNTAFYYTTYGSDPENANYPYRSAITGCGAYGHEEYLRGMWKLPSYTELEEISRRKDELSYISSNVLYWSSGETATNMARTYNLTSGTGGTASKATAYSVRCVRENLEAEYTIESDYHGGPISEDAFTIKLTLNGYFPHMIARVYNTDTGTSITNSSISGDNGTSTITLNIPRNTTGVARNFQIQCGPNLTSPIYSVLYEGTQAGGQLSLNTGRGRVVAKANATYSTTSSGTALSWQSAMGLHEDFRYSSFYTTGYSRNYNYSKDYNDYYHHNHPHAAQTGCGAYSEAGYPIGSWFVPTDAEMLEIIRRGAEFGLNSSQVRSTYWTSRESTSSPDQAYTVIGSALSNNETGKGFMHNTRCVRER